MIRTAYSRLPAFCVTAVVFLLHPAVPGVAQPPRAPRAAPFQLTLTADPPKPSATAEIHFHVHLRSHAKSDWLLYSPMQEGPGASYALHIRDHGTGEEVPAPFLADAHVPPGPVHLTRIPPGGSLNAESDGTAQSFGLVAGHTYDITAVYHSPLRPRTRSGTAILSQSDGEFTSNTVQITVAP